MMDQEVDGMQVVRNGGKKGSKVKGSIYGGHSCANSTSQSSFGLDAGQEASQPRPTTQL
jgi:hypothetical protein